MTRRSFFSRFTAVLATLPLVGRAFGKSQFTKADSVRACARAQGYFYVEIRPYKPWRAWIRQHESGTWVLEEEQSLDERVGGL